MSDYAWIIDKDHLDLSEVLGEDYTTEKGVMGPRGARVTGGSYDENKKELSQNYQHHAQFRMYDDDGELYYTGTLYWDGDMEEHQCYGPLGDFGTPNAGAVLIKYTGHPEWDCG